MSREVTQGWLKGHAIRTARKAGRCEYFKGADSGGRCRNIIAVGDSYVSGELSSAAGGYAQERYCLQCVPEAIGAGVNKESKPPAPPVVETPP